MNKRVLVIDDKASNIELLRAYFRAFQCETVGATSGRNGFAIAQQSKFDLFLVDLMMPEHSWNGYQTIIELKANPRTQHVPIVAVTGAGEEQKAYAAGCNGFLSRPFNTAKILRIITPLLARN